MCGGVCSAPRAAYQPARAAAPGGPAAASPSPAGSFTAAGSDWYQNPGSASDSPEAHRIQATLAQLVARYPDANALRAAGFSPDHGGDHWKLPKSAVDAAGGMPIGDGAYLIAAAGGPVTAVQLDTDHNHPTERPPSWPGVQWHQHEGSGVWMLHVAAGRPIDEAFVERSHAGH